MGFTDFLKATVLICAGAATALAAVSVAAAAHRSDSRLILFAIAWWFVAGLLGAWIGRRSHASPAIGRLLATARASSALPELHPGRALLNRLWPLLLAIVIAVGLAFFVPQVPAIGCGFAIIWALGWRHQEPAVAAIEDRDGVRFYIEPISPFAPIRLLRTPGFRATLPKREPAGEPALDPGR